MRMDATGRTIPEIDEQLPDSGIVALGDELLDNGLTVGEVRRRIAAGVYHRRYAIDRTIRRLQRDLAEAGLHVFLADALARRRQGDHLTTE